MSPYVDDHRINARDVEQAFRRYVSVTGDKSATLAREGANWTLRGRWVTIEGYGAHATWYAIHRFVDGYEAGRTA